MRRPPFIVGFVAVVLTLLVGLGFGWRRVRDQTAKEARVRHARECPTNLKIAFQHQRAYFLDHERYADDFEAMGFAPPRGNHAVYVLRRDGPVAARKAEVLPQTRGSTVIGVDEFLWARHSTAALLAQLPATFTGGVAEGVTGTCPEACEVVLACVTEFDDLPGVFTWSVATFPRLGADGGQVPAGEVVAERPWPGG